MRGRESGAKDLLWLIWVVILAAVLAVALMPDRSFAEEVGQNASEENGRSSVVELETDVSEDSTREDFEGAAAEEDGPDSTDESGSVILTAADSAIATGMWGTCPWSIGSDGTLTIRPGYGDSYGHDPSSSGTYYLVPWKNHRDKIRAIKVIAEGGRKAEAPEETLGLFAHLPNLVTADLSGLDTSGSYDIRYLFHDCPKLVSAKVASLDVSNVWYLSWLFASCESLTSVDVSGWDTSMAENTWNMFSDCRSLKSLNLSGWNTSRLRDASYMFSGCTSLDSLNLSGWNIGKGSLSTSGMFADCALNKLTVGTGYAPGVEEAVPRSRAADGAWYSAAAKRWFTRAELASRGASDTYTIDGPALIDIKNATVTVANQNYTGRALIPVPTVKYGGRTLRLNTDFTVSFKNNVEVGTATLTVMGKGEFTGSKSATFKIIGPYFIDANPADSGNHGAEVDWMGTSGISEGWEVAGGREFRGLVKVTRCDFAAFLYRMADLDDDGKRNNSIGLSTSRVRTVLAGVSDCSTSTSHAAEVAWLIESGISTGWPNKGKSTVSFRPMAQVTRQDMAAFLYRYADIHDNGRQDKSLKKGSVKATFRDVRSGDNNNHAREVEWLASVGVVKGWTVGSKLEFRGLEVVARQDMAAFMYRLDGWLG